MPIVLESVIILILIKYTEYNPQIKEWIQRTYNGGYMQSKKNNRVITKLLQARLTNMFMIILTITIIIIINKSMMDSTKAQGNRFYLFREY